MREKINADEGGVNFTTTEDKLIFAGFCTATMRNEV